MVVKLELNKKYLISGRIWPIRQISKHNVRMQTYSVICRHQKHPIRKTDATSYLVVKPNEAPHESSAPPIYKTPAPSGGACNTPMPSYPEDPPPPYEEHIHDNN